MRLRIQQNNCVKEQICSFVLLKLKGREGGLEADSEMGKQTRIWSQQTVLITFLLQCKPDPCSSTAETPRLDLWPRCTWDGNRNIPICAQLEKALQTSRAVIHHGCGTHSNTHKPAKPPQDKRSQQQLTQNARHQSLCTDKQLVKEVLQELRDVDL